VVRIMGQQIKIKFISQGFKDILCSGGVQNAVTSAANSIQSKANANNIRGGEGFRSETWMGSYGGGRWVASVSTTDRKSMIAEAEDKALSRAVSR
jgi:hypothetical protein